MPYCPKCGSEINEEMTFCPKCGAPLKATAPGTPTDWGRDRRRQEKNEKNEKQEKGEKYEKREHPFIGPLIGGLILIALGVISYLQILGYNLWQYTGPIFFIVIGLVIIISALARMARKKNPPT
ncbi:MAG: hypothetical protein QG670_2710 [Thermoproteota archaeon]|nr:hypothetical protein [Thermoproteota archaeon]